MQTIKVIQIGDGIGVVFPNAIARKLKLRAGDTLTAVERLEGVLLSTFEPEALRQLEIGRKIMREHRDVLAELAKR